MFRLVVMSSSPVVSVMVEPFPLTLKTIVSIPLLCSACAIALRSEPRPLSLVLVTVSVLGTQRPSSTSSPGRNVSRRRGAGERCFLCRHDENHMLLLLLGNGS